MDELKVKQVFLIKDVVTGLYLRVDKETKSVQLFWVGILGDENQEDSKPSQYVGYMEAENVINTILPNGLYQIEKFFIKK